MQQILQPNQPLKVLTYEATIVIEKPAETVFQLLTRNYAEVYKYANGIFESQRLGEIADGEEGCMRICYFSANKKSYMQETLADIDYNKMQFTNVISGCHNIPIVPNISKSQLKITPLCSAKCRVESHSEFRTSPYILGVLMKGVFKRTMMDYLISINHYIVTGEVVHLKNYKSIKRQWKLNNA